jgi:multidrug efflux pump subunit AcrB
LNYAAEVRQVVLSGRRCAHRSARLQHLYQLAVSHSILIVEFTRSLRKQGMPVEEFVAMACRVRLRPVLMTSLATILGMVPMALALEDGSELYAPLARAVIGGLSASVILTVSVVPAA